MTSFPSATSISTRFTSLSLARGPTANTRQRCGFSFALSGCMIPLSVNYSFSRTSSINRSRSECSFLNASLNSSSNRSLTVRNHRSSGDLRPVRKRGLEHLAAAEAGQLAQRRQDAVAELARHFLEAHPVDALVAAHCPIHQMLLTRLAAA